MRALLHCLTKPRIGIEIHEEQIRLLKLKIAHHTLMVEDFAILDLPSGCMWDGKIKNPDKVSLLLKQMVRDTQSQGMAAAIGLPAQGAISKKIVLPRAFTEEECEAEIMSNLSHYFPGNQEALCFDFIKLGAQDAAHDSFLLVASRIELRENYVSVMTKAGLCAKAVDVDSYALVRAAQYGMPLEESLPVMVMNIGASLVRAMVYSQDEIVFYQQWPVECCPDTFLLELCVRLKRILQIFQQISIKKVLFSGSHPRLAMLMDSIQQNINVQMIYANPFAHLTFKNALLEKRIKQQAGCLLGSFGVAVYRGFL